MDYARGLVDYINSSPTPYHAVDTTKSMLISDGFKELSEKETWDLENNKKYFVTRNGSSLIAFKTCDFNAGIGIAAAHTDSPCLRIKPISNRESEGYIQIGVELYGGLIAHSWFDRDLSIAGRVYVKEGDKFVSKLLKIDKPLLKIPSLAIHLDRTVNQKFEFDKETRMIPIVGQTHLCKDSEDSKLSEEEFQSVEHVIKRHNRSLIELIAKELNVDPLLIEDFELLLFDHQKATIGGLNDEFVFGARQDNLVSCYAATKALIESENKGFPLISLFDHEEIGSLSAQGADSSFLPDVLRRITRDKYFEVMAKSFIASVDAAHSVHPNYKEFHENNHKPVMNKGPVIKVNANQKYLTNSPGIVLFKNIAKQANIPLQLIVGKNNAPIGSTLGKFIAGQLGIVTLDAGVSCLSMHSIRECTGALDVGLFTILLKSFFENFDEMNNRIA
ncbi:unnamed protein product [Candida verbasci]|uniref:aspartyl aminopeptidase n=1 Tax=Candida verbasci TaxID=1227364 RepID=A0A9W4TSU7_9ASCO|nr:unnamed protein product [Candida verbasci]